jgi:histidine phosphotransfer protein HptB
VSADPATDPPALDLEALRDLVDLLGGDRDALREIVDAFLDEAPIRVSELRTGFEAGDAELVGRAAHTLKANAATFGARELEARSRMLEENARDGDAAVPKSLIDAVAASWDEAKPALVRLREGSIPL